MFTRMCVIVMLQVHCLYCYFDCNIFITHTLIHMSRMICNDHLTCFRFLWPCIVSKVWRQRKPTRCNNQMFIISFCLYMFRASLCPSSGEQRPCYCVWWIVLVLLDVIGSGCGALRCRMRAVLTLYRHWRVKCTNLYRHWWVKCTLVQALMGKVHSCTGTEG